MKKIILVVLLCLIPFLCDAQQIIVTKKKAGGACTEPASGTVILGASTEQDTTFNTLSVNGWLVCSHALTATWAETCETTTMTSLKGHGSSIGAGNVKFILYNSSTQIVSSATSGTNGEAEYTYTATFSSAPTITKGGTYYICSVVDTDYVYVPSLDTSGNQISFDNSASYASPPNPMTLNDSASDGTLGYWGVK